MSDEPVVVSAPLAGERVDRALSLLTGWSRREVRDLVAAGAVLVDDRVAARAERLSEGAVLRWTAGPPPATTPGPEPDVPVSVVYEDDGVIVVDKLPGLVVHPGAGHPTGTLVGGLLARYDLAGVGDPTRPGIVHRLDRDTSGLLVVARTPAAYEGLVRALTAREVRRGYDALVVGHLGSPRGMIDAPIGRSPRTPTKMAVRTGGREARTHYEVVAELAEATLLAVSLETGRTHQIRVHLAAIGHPVVGDAVYGRSDPRIGRPFLHAASLAFTHPVTGTPLRFHASRPPDLERALVAFGDPRSATR